MKQTDVRILVEGGIMIALATLLSFIKVFEMPQGGSVTAVSMAPILIYSCRHGVKKGLVVSTVYGILQYLLQGDFQSIQCLFCETIFWHSECWELPECGKDDN